MNIKQEKITETEEQVILEYIRQDHIELVKYLPYFYTKEENHLTGQMAVNVLRNLCFKFDENDIDLQEQLYLTLDKVIDGTIRLKYEQDKHFFRFRSVNQLDEHILKTFSKIDEYNEDFQIKNLASLLNFKINDPKYYEMCLENIKILYEKYKTNNKLIPEDTNIFYNRVLNKQADSYLQLQKKRIIADLTKILPYTKKKRENLIKGAKLKQIDIYLLNRQYQKLGITKEELLDIISNNDEYFNSLKKLKKENIYINKDQLNQINDLFINGKLTKETLEDMFPNFNSEVRTIILKKYTQVKSQFLDYISVTQLDIKDINLGYNYNNYMIGTQEQTNKNILKILTNLTEEDAKDILINGPLPLEMKLLLPIINYCDDFDTIKMIALLKNYPQVLKKMQEEHYINNPVLSEALPQFFTLIKITDIYNSSDNIVLSALGTRVTEQISKDRITSNNPIDYLETYVGMLNREYTFVPPIEGEYKDYYYETAHDADKERLLIGKNCDFSCIGPKGAGEEAYQSSLTGHNADVLMIKDKKTHSFVARSLCFRKGNYIVFAPIHGEDGIADNFYQPELLSEIANKMLEQSKKSNDTLEYVFITPDVRELTEFYELIDDTYLLDPFPHADLDEVAFLIGSRNKNQEVEIDSSIFTPVFYKTKREKVKEKSKITSEELTQLNALDILLTEDHQLKEEKSRNFTKVNVNNYDEVYKGQDWYITLVNGQVKDTIILPTYEERQKKELEIISKELNIKIGENEVKDLKISSRGGKL